MSLIRPATGSGKRELLERAKEFESDSNLAERRDSNFGLAQALFQAAIAVGSVSIVAASRVLVGISGVIAILALLLTINGFLLITHIPFV